jgi:hypothetical protein
MVREEQVIRFVRVAGMTLLTGFSALMCWLVFVWAMSSALAIEEGGASFTDRATLHRVVAVVPVAVAGLAALAGWWRKSHPLKWAAMGSMLTGIVLLLYLGITAGGF